MQIRDIEFKDDNEKIEIGDPCFYLARTINNGSFIIGGGVIGGKENKKVIIFCCSKDNNVVYWPSGAIGVFDDKNIMKRFVLIRQISPLDMKIIFEF